MGSGREPDRMGWPVASAAGIAAEEASKEHFSEFVKGDVVRYELPKIAALNFVMHEALGGGVTRSLRIDAHGKC